MTRVWVIGVASFVAGGAIAAGVVTAFPTKPAAKAVRDDTHTGPAEDSDGLKRANENLTESLQACDRKLAELRDHLPIAPASAVAVEAPAERDAGRGRRRDRGEPTADDWERMAQLGVVRTRIPCIRDTPWTPSARVADRLGLAPQDAQLLKDAYAQSNKRITDQVRPLCAKVLGSANIIDSVGANACIDAIANSARKANPEQAREALKGTAEVQSGKRAAPKDVGESPVLQQLTLALTNESKAFERDLAQKLGPEEAKRLASAPELCADRRTFRASEEREER